jgi:hypothetical protein
VCGAEPNDHRRRPRVQGRALAETVALAETLGARVYGEPQANSVAFPSDHPLFAGVLPGLSQEFVEPWSRRMWCWDRLESISTIFVYARGPLPDGMTVVTSILMRGSRKTYPVKVGILADPKAAMAIDAAPAPAYDRSAAGCGQAALGDRARAAPAGT